MKFIKCSVWIRIEIVKTDLNCYKRNNSLIILITKKMVEANRKN